MWVAFVYDLGYFCGSREPLMHVSWVTFVGDVGRCVDDLGYFCGPFGSLLYVIWVTLVGDVGRLCG